MRATALRLFLPLFILLASLSAAHAQLQMGLETERLNYLLYEAIPLHLTIENLTGTDITFQDSAEKPWLTFFVTGADHSLVMADHKVPGKPLKLAAGETVSLTVDITPLYRMRDPGTYKVQAVINLEGSDYLSEPVLVTIQTGHSVWSETRAVDGSPRTYSLVRFSPNLDRTNLYLRVEDVAQNLVYGNAYIGEIVDVAVPQVFFDNRGNINILQLSGNAIYRYTRAGVDGQLLAKEVYDSVALSQPRLVKESDGGIIVLGGRQESADTKRERLSDNQARIPQTTESAPESPFAPATTGAVPTAPTSAAPGGSPQSPPSGSTK